MTISLRISRIVQETDQIRSFELGPESGAELPPFEAGAHVSVRLENGLVRQYSLANDPAERGRYLLGVLREPKSRGGSAWIFENWKPDDPVRVEPPTNHFPLARRASRHVLIAGGIGITPLLAMARTLERERSEYSLFYCTRNPEATAFRDLLSGSCCRERVRFVHDGGDPRRGLDLKEILRQRSPGTHVYACGPAGLIRGVREAASHWPADCVHFEYFAADPQYLAGEARTPTAFAVQVASTGQVFEVPADRSVLSVLSENGIEVPKLCEQGVCGSCLTAVREGVPDHRDSVQTETERASNQYMALCCSRARSPLLVLEL